MHLVPQFTFNPTTGCAPALIQFTEQCFASNAMAFWNWDFGDGGTSTVPSPQHTYTTGGTFYVRLAITDSIDCNDTLILPIQINSTPVAAFTMQNATGCAPIATFFQANSPGATQFFWDFGDGTTGSGDTITHIYQNAGHYSPRLIVQNAAGCADTLTQFQSVFADSINASFSANVTQGCNPLQVQFTNLSTSLSLITSWQWDFGDANLSTLSSPAHTYTMQGIYTVTLVVTNATGCTETIQMQNYVQVFAPPQAAFIPVSDTICANTGIQFTNLSQVFSPPATWAWTFGDANASASQNPYHVYQNAGNFTVTLTVTDQHGCQDSASGNILVHPVPVAQFSASDSAGCLPLTVDFFAGSAGVLSWDWDFGSAGTAPVNPAQVTFTQSGYHTVTLIVTGIGGCADTLSYTNFIFVDSVHAAFMATAQMGCSPFPVLFSDSSWATSPIVSYAWSFGDSGTSTLQNPIYYYANPGTYNSYLIVIDSMGCSDTSMVDSVEVLDPDPPYPPQMRRATVRSEGSNEVEWEAYSGSGFIEYTVWREWPAHSDIWTKAAQIPGISNTSFIDASGVNTLDAPTCYKVTTTGMCGESDRSSVPAHCTMNLETEHGYKSDTLTWTAYEGWREVEKYQVYKVTSWDNTNMQFLAEVPADQRHFVNVYEGCDESYDYRILAVSNTGVQSLSDTSGGSEFIPPTITGGILQRVTVEDDAFIRVEWKIPDLPFHWKTLVERNSGTGWQQIASVNVPDQVYDDHNVNVFSQSFEYRLRGMDSCGNISGPDEISRSILLTTDLVERAPMLNWSPYIFWTKGVDFYQVEIFNEVPHAWEIVAQVPADQNYYHDDKSEYKQEKYCYRVTAFEKDGNHLQSLSNTSCESVGPVQYFPNAFSPNGDNLNDRFAISGKYLKEVNMEIFDRWGKMLWKSSPGEQGWNGTHNGTDCPEGVYIWKANGMGFDGTEFKRNGTVTLLR